MPVFQPVKVQPKPGPSVDAGSTDSQTPAVQGTSYQTWTPQGGPMSGTGVGVGGSSGSGTGVYGSSGTGAGVQGQSFGFDAVVGESSSDAHAGVTGRNTTKGANGGVGLYGVGGQYAGKFDGDVQVNGTLNVQVDIVLAAGDFAEEFDLTGSSDAEPGTVMVLDDEETVQPSHRPYDRRVAGIISGAGEYRPAIILDKRATTRPRGALALVGKAYCKVDANYAPIEIGDILTTSPTYGHAMKAVDPTQSFGAVIGKALRPLSDGQGLIPVLVALQ